MGLFETEKNLFDFAIIYVCYCCEGQKMMVNILLTLQVSHLCTGKILLSYIIYDLYIAECYLTFDQVENHQKGDSACANEHQKLIYIIFLFARDL